MSMISLRLPESLHARIRALAKQENVSINQLVTLAVAEKIAALDTDDLIRRRAARGDRAKFERVLSKVADIDDPNDEEKV